MSEIEKALAELKALMKYRSEQLGYVEDFRGLGLTSRKNLCLHPSVKREKSGGIVDARCRSLTAGFVKEKKERGEDVELCVYHEVSFSTCYRENLLTLSEPRSFGATQSHTSGCLHVRRCTQIRRGAEAMPVLYSPTNGEFSDNSQSTISNRSSRCPSAMLSSTHITIY
jgi:hypothetical protein